MLRPLLITSPMLALCACAFVDAPEPLAVQVGSAAPSTPATWAPPDDWRTRTSVELERLLPSAPVEPTADALGDLTRGLGERPAVATRAALLLARTESPAAYERLLARLELRFVGPDRADDAGDSTAARALGLRPLAARSPERLVALAAGPDPHPDLEVRTECAASALALGREEGLPFLLAVLRIDTAEAVRRGERLTDSPTTAWARGRAAEVLCALAGVEHRLWTDAPLEEREARALELERLLSGR